MRRHSSILYLLGMIPACSQSPMNTIDPGPVPVADAGVDAAIEARHDAAVLPDLLPGTAHGRVIFDKYNNVVNVPVSNGQIGFVGESAMAMTDDHGNYRLVVPPRPSLVLLVPLDGEISVQRALTSPPADIAVDLHVLDIDAYVGAVSRVHGTLDLFSHGTVVVRFAGSTKGGYTADLGAVHGGGFVFSRPNFFDPVASTTTLAAGDSIYFYAVELGMTTLTITVPSGQPACRDDYAPAATQYPVNIKTMTEIVLNCG